MGRGGIVIEAESLLTLFDHFLMVPGKEKGVRQVQSHVNVLRGQLRRPRVSGDGVGGVPLFQVAIAPGHQAREAVSLLRTPQEDDCRQQYQAESKDDPNYAATHWVIEVGSCRERAGTSRFGIGTSLPG